MHDSDKRQWVPPKLTSFANAEEAWAHYKSKCSPEELLELKAFMELMVRKAEARAAPQRRRA